jgi:hypothetical protein
MIRGERTRIHARLEFGNCCSSSGTVGRRRIFVGRMSEPVWHLFVIPGGCLKVGSYIFVLGSVWFSQTQPHYHFP